ncbi:DUF3761 domain-containing protein [Amycolatopsis sp. NBC_01480]|uniref:DUF3761 domain-containing protein n=1 Tax=Amycolatopsis sp. NBC_01480 TaxID=2903562 RepID=UPI002E2AB766|nr:DUF3761 domain-containing protein [Amycolatopsis sp. NBC_01480]
MLRKLGMVLAAGALVAGCGVGTLPVKDSGVVTPDTTTSSLPAYSPPEATSDAAIPTTSDSPVAVAPVAQPPAVTKKAVPKIPATKKAAAQPTTPAACGSDYYRNSSGACVHRPSSNPSGATAQCKDGSYSYSQHRSGTCSGHGGVKQWL